MVAKTSVQEWLDRANLIHNHKYTYPTERWLNFNSKSKLPIVCPVHGEFHQSMSNHTHKSNPTGCAYCAERKKLSVDERMSQAKSVHGDRYDYSDWPTEVNAKTLVTTLCRVCGQKWRHNIDNHIRGKGCPNCKSYNSVENKKRIMNENNERHKNKCADIIKRLGQDSCNYDKLVLPFRMKVVCEFECKTHGEFLTTPYNHFIKGTSCPACVSLEMKSANMFGFEKWQVFLTTIHNNYNFRRHECGSNTAKDKIYATCKIHGEWTTSIDSLKNSGCPACKGQSQTYLYVNHVENGFLKFGIASDIDKRISQQNRVNSLRMERMICFVFGNYSDCRLCESEIKKSVRPVLSKKELKDGWTETCSVKHLHLIITMCKSFGGRLVE